MASSGVLISRCSVLITRVKSSFPESNHRRWCMKPSSTSPLSYRTKLIVLVVIVMVALVLVPVIPFDTSVALRCARSGLPCPLYPAFFFWSVTAYYYGVGAYIAPTGYGFQGRNQWLPVSILILAWVVTVLVARSQMPKSRRPCNP